jgi:hypothetical protein
MDSRARVGRWRGNYDCPDAALDWLLSIRWKKFAKKQQLVSPITVDNHIYADCDLVKNEDGTDVPNVYSVALCLSVSNALENGATLKNVKATFYYGHDRFCVLPIRESATDMINLRHGETIKFEIGRTLYRSIGNEMPAMFRGFEARTVSKFQIEHRVTNFSNFRHFDVSNTNGGERQSLGQINDSDRLGCVNIIISADDVVSKTLRFQTNFYATRFDQWLVFLPEDYCDGE